VAWRPAQPERQPAVAKQRSALPHRAAGRHAAAALPGFRLRARLSMAQAGPAALLRQASLPMAAAWRHRAADPSDERPAEESD
jgi:hypothetical protein